MKKKLTIVATVLIACTITINVISNNKENDYQDDNIPIVRKNEFLLSYYLEDDNGEYILTSQETWPTDGYTFNTTLSKCENGSTLSWDSTNKVVAMTGNVSDKCYVYFDKIVKPIIKSSSILYLSCDTDDISIYLDYESPVKISKIYFSFNDSDFVGYDFSTFSTSSTDSYSRSSLYGVPSKGTEVITRVYLEDINGGISEVYTYSSVTVTCFPAGTKILTINSYKNIEDIKINDVVYSYNETTNKVELNKVTKTFIHEDIEIYNLYLDNGIIRVTPYHRFYIFRNNSFEWLTVKDLKLTDKLFNSNKQLINIKKIEYMQENNTVYNFEVANNHTYFVSENNILVHNAKGC